MAVTFVAGSNPTYAEEEAASISGAPPAGIADDDTLVAAVFGRAALTPPSGWSVLQTRTFIRSGVTTHLTVYGKDTVTSADASTSFTFDCATTDRMELAYAVLRGVDTVGATTSNVVENSTTVRITPAALTAAVDDEMFVYFVAMYFGVGLVASTPTPQTGFTLITGGPRSEQRLSGAYRTRNTGESNSGVHNQAPEEEAEYITYYGSYTQNNSLGAVVLRFEPAPVTPDVIAAVPTPLGSPAILMRGAYQTRVAVPSPLGSVKALLRPPPLETHLAVPSPLGAVRAAAYSHIAGLITGFVTRYVMDLTTSTGAVHRIPISSWQATLQVDSENYIQCVVPAADQWSDEINDSVMFQIFSQSTTLGGAALEIEMATAFEPNVQIAGGTSNYTATLSGYTDAYPLTENPPASLDRTLTGVRTVFIYTSGIRVRCSLDQFVKPGQRVYHDGQPFIAAYVNYYAMQGDQYMDVGERV